MMATNTITGTNGSGLGPQDMALTEFDRNLIIRFRATLIQRLGGTPAAWTPVTFRSDNGVFTVGGVVSSIVLKQRVLATLQTFPGVVRVNDQLVVDTNVSVNSGASAVGTEVNAGALGVNAGGSARVPAASATVPARFPTNALTPTGRPATGAP